MADPANTRLGKMLLEEISPVVMVICTPSVEESCLKNDLNLVQMLSPFCFFNNIDVPVRTASDQPYRLQKFRLRLVYASDIRQPNFEAAKERLKQVVTQAGEKDLDELCSDSPPIADLLARSEEENLPSWFQIFNKEFVRTMSFSDHEAFDHPVACLLVVSSKDEQPVNRFIDLFNPNKLPSLLNDGAMDPEILKHYLLVHDNQDSSTEKATKILAEMRSTFGADCQLLSINSSQDILVEHQHNPWAFCKPDASASQNLGCFLSIEDLSEMKNLIQELSSKHIIPYMEQKIRLLNQQVAATRKGFRNQIKNLWWRKGKEDIADSPNGPMYTFNSIESQIRLLGDYAFMLRDYELALSNYRLISTDYKLDKAWKRYAGVQEMLGLTYYMSDQSRKEAEYCMENAFNTYLKIGSSGQKNATRCGLWWVEMLKARDQYNEAASVYFRICGEEPLHSAVMLEQASYCYLLSKPPMLHKYGFHLVLAGDHYKKCDQIKHAVHTFRNAISVYKGTTWSHIRDHVHFHIGQWYAHLGSYDLAVAHMLEILGCSHQSKTTQELFLKDFIQIIQKTGKTFEVVKLPLPVINSSSLKVIFEDHRTYASPTAATVKEGIWSSLEQDLVPSSPLAKSNWLELQSKLISKKSKESNVCVAGEAVRVDIEFKNPLQISLFVSSVSLICELSASSDEKRSDEGSSVSELQKDAESTKMTNWHVMDESTSFSSSKVDFSLEGGESVMVQLTVTPRVEGILQVVGVGWKLSDSVVGFHKFESIPTRRKNVKGRQGSKHFLTDNLKFVVIKSLPRLEGFIHPFPKSAYAGDVRYLVLELKNHSKFTVKNLKMKISNPRFMCIGSRESLNADFPSCLELEKKYGHCSIQDLSSNMSQPLFIFPEDTIIQGETPLLWPVWFRAAVPGNISLYISIYYEMEDTSSIMRYRTLRIHHSLQVLPSLDVSFQLSPCPSKFEEFLVRMDVVNKTSNRSFQAHQLSCVGDQWEVTLLQPVDTIFPSQSLLAGQALSCFFTLKNHLKSVILEDKEPSLSPSLGSFVKLDSKGSDESFFDPSSSPLADFHQSERLQLENSQQGDPCSIDFILISWPIKSDVDPGISDPPHLFTHHACHCSVESATPISWLLEGPQILYHNFYESFCELKLKMTFYNSSKAAASVQIKTSDSVIAGSLIDQSASAISTSSNQAGWQDVSLLTDTKVKSDVHGTELVKSPSLDSVSSFIWSGSSSTTVQLEPMSTMDIPLQICGFSPGTYDLSNYVLHWNLLCKDDRVRDEGTIQYAGTCKGYPYYLTVLQSI